MSSDSSPQESSESAGLSSVVPEIKDDYSDDDVHVLRSDSLSACFQRWFPCPASLLFLPSVSLLVAGCIVCIFFVVYVAVVYSIPAPSSWGSDEILPISVLVWQENFTDGTYPYLSGFRASSWFLVVGVEFVLGFHFAAMIVVLVCGLQYRVCDGKLNAGSGIAAAEEDQEREEIEDHDEHPKTLDERCSTCCCWFVFVLLVLQCVGFQVAAAGLFSVAYIDYRSSTHDAMAICLFLFLWIVMLLFSITDCWVVTAVNRKTMFCCGGGQCAHFVCCGVVGVLILGGPVVVGVSVFAVWSGSGSLEALGWGEALALPFIFAFFVVRIWEGISGFLVVWAVIRRRGWN